MTEDTEKCQRCGKDILREEPRIGIVYATESTYEECYDFVLFWHEECAYQAFYSIRNLKEIIEKYRIDSRNFVYSD